MNWLICFAACVVLGGCVTPDMLREYGTRTVLSSQREPSEAARCVARRAENYDGATAADIRTGNTPNSFEITVRTAGTLFAYIEIHAAGAGSAITFVHFPDQPVAESLNRAWMTGC